MIFKSGRIFLKVIKLVFFSVLGLPLALLMRLKFYSFAYFVDCANEWLPNSRVHQVPIQYADYGRVRSRTNRQVALPEEMRKRRDLWLESLGVGQYKPIFIFSNRDPVHLSNISPNRNWAYHGYRDTSIGNMMPMVENGRERVCCCSLWRGNY